MALGDYGRFLEMNLKGLAGENDEFLSAKTIQRLHRSLMQDEYALGWGAYSWDGVPTSTHAGSAGSFYAIVALQSKNDIGVAVVLNSGGERSSEAADSLLQALLTRYVTPPQ